MGDGGVVANDGGLAGELVAALEPRLKSALNHPTRREILRLLQAGGARSVGELATELSPLSRGEVSYHAQVLEGSECVAADGFRPGPGGEERLLRSTLADSEQAQLVLRAARRSDQGLRQPTVEGGSAGALTMFRVPRPGRTVRLLERHGRGAERSG
ncbi:MAG TPA: helix-turn-helix domain-containing protein [Solirubrobacterales bacterium]|nr:helix-turn-helix domain-containing protein [Solirubrobacterales bacterium]